MTQEIDIYKKAEIAIANAHGIYLNHEGRLLKANEAVSRILEQAEKGMNDDIYANAGSLIKKLATTIKTFNEERKDVTRAAQEIVKAFTAQENSLDYKKEGTDAYKLKKLMDDYAQKKIQEKEAKEREEKKRIEKQREENSVVIAARNAINKMCSQAASDLKDNIQTLIDSVELDNYDEIKKELTSFDTRVPEGVFKGLDVQMTTVYITDKERKTIISDVLKKTDIKEIYEPLESEVSVFLHESIAKLPSIKKELEEIASANKREQQKLLKEKQQREEEERLLREKEKEEKEQQTKLLEAQQKQQLEIQAQFDLEASVESTSEIKAKKSYEIKMTLPASLMDIMRFWASEQDWSKLDDEKVGRVTIDRIKKFCEKAASDGQFIESDFIEYKEVVTSKI